MSILKDKDFKNSVHCLDCVYEDLGYNGKMLCQPKTKQCQPLNSYDMAMQSRLRKLDIVTPKNMSQEAKNYAVSKSYEN